MTSPILNPVSKFIPTVKGINFAAILVSVLLFTLEKWIVYQAAIPLAVLSGVLGVVKTFGQILFFTTLIRALVMVLGFALILLNSLFYNIFGVLWAIA